MPMNTSVRWMHSGMQGAPVIDNNWGDLTAMLRACCVTGFNVRPIQSITCQGTKATIQCAGHGYLEHQVVQIENATPEGYNGAHRVVSVEGANTLTIELESELPEAQAAPGQTLQMRTAPLGWESLFDDGGQKLVLRSTDVQSTRNVLRVDDSLPAGYDTRWAKFARVLIAQEMKDLDTFVGARAPFDPVDPTKGVVPKGSGSSMRSGWFKWYYATYQAHSFSESSAAGKGLRNWWLAGDGRTFYLGVACQQGWFWATPWGAGDLESLQSPDPFATFLAAAEHDGTPNHTVYAMDSGDLGGKLNTKTGLVVLRDYLGEGGNVRFTPRSLNVAGSYQTSGWSTGVPYPNGPGNGLLLHPVWALQDNGHLRGRFRGLYHVLHKQTLGHLAIVDGVAGLPGRKAMLVETWGNASNSGSVAIDITGPWS